MTPVIEKNEKKVGSAKFAAIREYNINGTKYIVRATVKDGANEDASTKVRRLIRNEISLTAKNNSQGQTGRD